MLAAGFGRAHAGGHALADERGLQLGHRADDGEHRPAHRAFGVDLILDADKAHAEVVERLECRQQVARAASWASPRGIGEGSVRNPSTPRGRNGTEATPGTVHPRVHPWSRRWVRG